MWCCCFTKEPELFVHKTLLLLQAVWRRVEKKRPHIPFLFFTASLEGFIVRADGFALSLQSGQFTHPFWSLFLASESRGFLFSRQQRSSPLPPPLPFPSFSRGTEGYFEGWSLSVLRASWKTVVISVSSRSENGAWDPPLPLLYLPVLEICLTPVSYHLGKINLRAAEKLCGLSSLQALTPRFIQIHLSEIGFFIPQDFSISTLE